jgi:hypothetical protein
MTGETDQSGRERTPGGSIIQRYRPLAERPRLGYSNAPTEWVKLREDHYARWFGPPSHVWHEVLPLIPHVDVQVHPPSPALGRDFFTLATSGMSDERMALDADTPAHHARAELILYLSAAEVRTWQSKEPWHVSVLRFLAHFPFDNHTWLGFSHTIQNGTPATAYTPGSTLTTALLLTPMFETPEFETGLHLGGDPVNLLWVTFLTDDEVAYKLQHGFSALLDRFQAVNYPQVTDVFRRSVLA